MTLMRKAAGMRRGAGAAVGAMALGLAGLLGSAAPAAAAQDLHWDVSGTFADGGAFSGAFDVDKFGVLFDWDLTTTDAADGSGFKGQTYRNGTPGATSANADASIAVGYNFQDVFQLAFAHSLFSPRADNAVLLTDPPGGSFECVSSFSCFRASGGVVRRLVSGSAHSSGTIISGGGGGGGVSAAPEPQAWALLIGGFAAAGAVLRRRRPVADSRGL